MLLESCATCRFMGGNNLIGGCSRESGLCFRRSPSRIDRYGNRVWLTVQGDDWCGEWELEPQGEDLKSSFGVRATEANRDYDWIKR